MDREEYRKMFLRNTADAAQRNGGMSAIAVAKIGEPGKKCSWTYRELYDALLNDSAPEGWGKNIVDDWIDGIKRLEEYKKKQLNKDENN